MQGVDPARDPNRWGVHLLEREVTEAGVHAR